MLAIRYAVLAALCVALLGCRASYLGEPGPDARDMAAGWDAPRTDLVPAVGTPGALDIATWNIQNFPLRASTPALMADLIASLDLDLVAVQEIASVAAFDELTQRLPEHDAILSEHVYADDFYQKLGFLYRRDLLVPIAQELLFTDDRYAFPRPPLEVRFAVISGAGDAAPFDFTAIAVHLKAGVAPDDAMRRELAMQRLDEHLRMLVDGNIEREVVVLGDFNEAFTTSAGQDVWAPLLGDAERYWVQTTTLEPDAMSFVKGSRLLDHIVSTAALDAMFEGASVQIPRLDQSINGYVRMVSDHLPVVTSMPGLFSE